MRRYALILFLLAAPLVASAHAAPVQYTPAPGSSLLVGPASVSIQFSERVDLGASALKITGPGGAASQKPVLSADGRTMSAVLVASSTGEYTVTWSVVSADDGHFTRGEYSF